MYASGADPIDLIPTSMTLSGVIALAFFKLNSIALLANYVIVVEDIPIMSVKYSSIYNLPLLAITNLPCIAVSL